MKTFRFFMLCVSVFLAYQCAFADQPSDSSEYREQYMSDNLRAHNAIFAEGGGNGLLYSFNYEYRPMTNFSLRAGVGFFSHTLNQDSSSVSGTIYMIPVLANFLLNFGASNIEIGAGITVITGGVAFSSGNDNVASALTEVCFTGRLGYLLMPKDGGFMFGAAYTPFIIPGFNKMLSSAGISLGWVF